MTGNPAEFDYLLSVDQICEVTDDHMQRSALAQAAE